MKNIIGEDYKSNSHKSKEEPRREEKKIEKVATGKVKTKKKSGANKVADTNAIIANTPAIFNIAFVDALRFLESILDNLFTR